MPVPQHQFPKDFLWGAATSSQQIEGAVREDGRGESIWDRFAHTPGRIADGSVPDVACDHYHRWPGDIELMKKLGLGAYRFSIAWPRVLPTGAGTVNEAGLDFYERLVDGLLAAGIEPFPTLYHWDLPQALQESGGWAARETVDRFCEYTTVVARRLGDRVTRWVTHNEPWCIAVLGHEEGHHAPGLKEPATALRASHHLLLSHGRAVPILRAEVKGAEVGLVHNHCPAYPYTDNEGDRDAARWFDGFFNRWYLDPLYKGEYPADAIADRVAAGHLPGPALPFLEPGDLAEIAAPTDFLGINYYSRNVMRTTSDGRREAVKMVSDEELTDMGWEVYPDGYHRSLVEVVRDYAPGRIYLTENGAAYDDPVGADGRIRDERRIAYLHSHLLAVRRAIADGAPVAGYFAWSLLDNFEWGLGFEKKFGLYALDPDTLDRIPRDSADFYRGVIRNNGLDDIPQPLNQGETRAN